MLNLNLKYFMFCRNNQKKPATVITGLVFMIGF